LASEISGVHVLNSNHDFYWEGGAPAENRRPGEAPGIRDHFFRNHGNRPFFEVFRRLLPWNGRRWIQVNINRKQSDTLVREHGFSRDVVREVGTAIDNSFFSRCSLQEKMLYRGTMAHILSNGSPIIRPVALDDHLASLSVWMKNQVPVVCAADNDIEVNIASPSALYLLQPTRVIARKRIERDCHLLGALFDHEPFRSAFDEHPDRTLTLHITGPVPIEHEADLAAVLAAFGAVLRRLPSPLARRVFIAFSVGCEDHESLADEGLDRLHIDTIYKLADAVVFPSKTEGRGLPIVESSAARVPVICSRYCPEEVFAEVVGEHLDPDRRIRYTLFPEDGFTPKILGEITDIILFPARIEERIEHNYRAVEARYGMQAMTTSFHGFLRAFLPV
jgi:glycosyltransferase involved in cell wall biosynthesis